MNFQSDDLRFDASQIQLACDSTQTWTSSLSSFPGNTIGDVARTNIRRPADGNGFNNRRVSNIRDPWDGTSRPGSRPLSHFFRLLLNFLIMSQRFGLMILEQLLAPVALTQLLERLLLSKVSKTHI